MVLVLSWTESIEVFQIRFSIDVKAKTKFEEVLQSRLEVYLLSAMIEFSLRAVITDNFCAGQENKEMRYLFTVIDEFSRHLLSLVPLKNKQCRLRSSWASRKKSMLILVSGFMVDIII